MGHGVPDVCSVPRAACQSRPARFKPEQFKPTSLGPPLQPYVWDQRPASPLCTTVLLRPYVQGVLRVTPHVHLIRCSDRDITGD